MKHVAVVGGSQGLGKAIVQELLGRGYQVTVLGRTKPADSRIHNFYAADATRTDWVSTLDQVEDGAGSPIDIIVFVAGSAVFGQTTQIPESDARDCFELNFWACSSAARAAATYWEQERRPGKFLAVLSIVARHAVPFEAYYSASKAAAARFLEALNLEYGVKKIEFLCAFPGMLNTAFRRRSKWFGLAGPNGEQGSAPEDVARAIVKLVEGRRKQRVIGWRERGIDLADRCLPGFYDRLVLRTRVARRYQTKNEY